MQGRPLEERRLGNAGGVGHVSLEDRSVGLATATAGQVDGGTQVDLWESVDGIDQAGMGRAQGWAEGHPEQAVETDMVAAASGSFKQAGAALLHIPDGLELQDPHTAHQLLQGAAGQRLERFDRFDKEEIDAGPGVIREQVGAGDHGISRVVSLTQKGQHPEAARQGTQLEVVPDDTALDCSSGGPHGRPLGILVAEDLRLMGACFLAIEDGMGKGKRLQLGGRQLRLDWLILQKGKVRNRLHFLRMYYYGAEVTPRIRQLADQPVCIRRFISATACGIPTRRARLITECPMFNSCRCGMERISVMLW